ncbi:hypothetical protein [Halorussus ruber]|uniref:hypothetical protein n=1 Tax=Halorussus ruber TaxID=1126238 RepID=UPI0010923601|nr:hypothetical protein [Halorussus ruber]
MSLESLLVLLELVLVWLAVVAIVFGVIFVGGALVAAVSLPVTLVLPTVRCHLLALTENVTGVRPDSLTDWRFLGAYFVFVYAYGLSLLLGSAWFAESLPATGRLLSAGGVGMNSTFAVVELAAVALAVVAALLVVRPVVANVRLRAVGEWTLFLVLVAGLTAAAAFVVPWLLLAVLDGLVL